MTEKLQPWDRQPSETDKAWAAFMLYRDMSPNERSLDKAYKLYCDKNKRQNSPKKASTSFKKWSSCNEWSSRCRAYDRHLDRIKAESVEDVLRYQAEQWPIMLHELEIKAFEALQRRDLKRSLSENSD